MSADTTLLPGSPVSLIWYCGEEPKSVIGTVYSVEPLWLEVSDDDVENVQSGESVKILFQHAGTFETGSAKVANTTRAGGRWRVELTNLSWSKADRRSHKRYPALVKAVCRYVSEAPSGCQINQFTVTTKDISMGGAWIASDSTIPAGSILNVELSTSPTASVKALGVVAWTDPNGRGFGVEFLDLIGTSRHSLTNFIQQQAA